MNEDLNYAYAIIKQTIKKIDELIKLYKKDLLTFDELNKKLNEIENYLFNILILIPD